MTFATPQLLWLLLAPVALLVWELTHRRRSASLTRPKILRAEAGASGLRLSALSSQLSAASSSARPRYWLTLGLALAITALARPQYGRLEEPVFDQSREILLAIDLSRSMLAPDVKPSRLERAKLLIQSLLEKLEGERVGLVVFAGTSFLQSPLSADYEILREFLPALGPEFLPQGGSNYGALLDASIQAFSSTNAADRFLVILSDGEATDEDWKKRTDELKKKNIRVLGLGIGTPGGAMIPDGTGGFIKDERGAVVLSKLESTTLQELATATGGVYRDASGWLDLAGLVKETVEAGQKGQFLEKNTIRLAERFQWPLALGLWCLLVSFYAELPVRPRPRDIKLTPHPQPTPPSAPRPLATAVVSLALCALVLGPWALGITPAKPSASAPADTPAPASDALAKIIGRVAAAETRTARDWAELGRETVTWGGRLQSEQQQIPEGPVRDALAAVDAGAKLDPKTADWPKLREELAALLKQSEDQKQDQQKQDEKDQQDQKDKQDQKDQQDKDQKNQDQKKSDKQDPSKDQKDSQQEKSDEQKKQDQQQQDKDDQAKQGESAFGDMKKNEPPPPAPPEDPGTQKVGGQPEKKESEQQPADPSLALPLQKLEQLRNQDSPAHLFQLMEGDKKSAPKTKGKDW
jgi:Ca-activated chloride channel family protein